MKRVIQYFEKKGYLYRLKEPLSKHTSIKVGGEASVLLIPSDRTQLLDAIRLLNEEEIPYKVIGNGSNLVCSDKPYEGVIIKNTRALTSIKVDGTSVIAESSVSLVKLSLELCRLGLSGMEFVHGIPGTVGGGLFMNCGAYNREMKDVVEWVKVLDDKGEVRTFTVEECDFRYRHSKFKHHPNWLILEGKFKLEQKDPNEIKEVMDRRKKRRQEVQPLEYPSCGSIFKNPEGTHAYLFIDQAGLRGYRIGGAQISEKHCNFIINDQGAKAMDVRCLIELAQVKVYETSGLILEREVEYFNF
ncbi:MAG TPA: UDP-N-acetylmuramate dehydrogenase [Haloplasmataceae bacterium]